MLLTLANFYAWYSMEENNRHPILRTLCRKSYQILAEAQETLSLRHLRQIWQYKEGNYAVDTYSPMYANECFAGWMRQMKAKVPIVDGGYWKVRECTSYCACKIRQSTGVWLKCRPIVVADEEIDPLLTISVWSQKPVHHAKDWLLLLHTLGYESVDNLQNGHLYVGVNSQIGDSGEVVWFERRHLDGRIGVSTYRQGQHCTLLVKPKMYVWVKIA